MPLEVLQNGRYRHLRLLGSGGMGEVYLMEDTRVNRQVAIKVIRTGAGPHTDSDAARLFQREARAIAALDHPNILPLYDFGEEALEGATLTYMVMPYCAEGSFATWLRQRGSTTPLSPQDIASFTTQAADALQFAHDRQVMHLDVKAANFLLRSNRKDPTHPTLLLADFGVARLGATTANSSRTVRGTPTTMAPEQWSSTPVPATDQYALAVMAYELLLGHPPFRGNMEQLMYQHFQVQAPAPSTFNPRLTAAIDDVLLRALAKSPEARFPTISVFADVLERAVQSLPTQATLRPAGASPSEIRATLAISKTEAVTGTNRTLTLPGGRKGRVSVPPGAYNGQVIRLPLGDPSSAGLSTGTLILTLAIQQTEPAMLVPDAEHAQQTMLSADAVANPNPPPTVLSPPPPAQSPTPVDSDPHLPSTVRASDPNLPPIIAPPSPRPATPAPSPAQSPTPVDSDPHLPWTVRASDPNLPPIIAPSPPPPRPAIPALPLVSRKIARPSRVNGRTILLIGLALLVIVSGVGLFSLIHANQVATDRADATATAQANATANVLNATTTAQANATATAQTQALATASAIAAIPNHYGGTQAFDDLLRDNSSGLRWYENGSNCMFTGGAYHVSESSTKTGYYCGATPDFRNFAFEVRMTISKGDGWGGIIFRFDSTKNTNYIFHVNRDGTYALDLNQGNSPTKALIPSTSTPAIHRGLGQTNVIAVVANGSTITLYVNYQKLASKTGVSYSHGQIGVVAFANSQPTEVVYSKAKVWTF